MFSKTAETANYTLVFVPLNERCWDRALSLPLEFRSPSWPTNGHHDPGARGHFCLCDSAQGVDWLRGDLLGGERPKGTNTKVLVEIVRRICRDIVASTDRQEETLSAALLICCPAKKRITQDPSASTSSDNANLSEMSFGIVREFRFSGGMRVS